MRYLVPIVVGAVLLLSPAALAAPMACAPRGAILAQLSAKFHEAPVASGIANNGSLVELVASEQGATWTLVVTMPNGTSCLLAAGEDWQEREPEPEGEPS